MTADTLVRMDRMYRHQRYIYDATRKYFLLGRDGLIRALPVRPGDHVLEVGCGTGRNLIALARRHPEVLLYGVDASAAMLETAGQSIAQAGLAQRVRLARGLGEALDPGAMFGLDRPFDAILISYARTMIPAWPDVVDAALAHLRLGGRLAVVDFWDQRHLPHWFGRLLRAWLDLFDVRPCSDMPDFFRARAHARGGILTIDSLFGGYAFRLVYTAPSR